MKKNPAAEIQLEVALKSTAEVRGASISVSDSDSTKWASVSFTGARHRITVRAMTSSGLDDWLNELPDIEFSLRGHILADLAVESVRRENEAVTVVIEALTVVEYK